MSQLTTQNRDSNLPALTRTAALRSLQAASNPQHLRKLNPKRAVYFQRTGKTVSLAQYAKDAALEAQARVQIETWLHDMGSLLDLSRPLQVDEHGNPDPRVQQIADFILSEFSMLTLEDIYVHLRNFFTGKYGPTYRSLDNLLPSLRKYVEEDRKAAHRAVEEHIKAERRQQQLREYETMMQDPERRAAIEQAQARFSAFVAEMTERVQANEESRPMNLRQKLELLKSKL